MSDDGDELEYEYEEPVYLGDRRFFEFVDLGGRPDGGTIGGKVGPCAARPAYLTEPTNLVLRVEEAWRTPYSELTCEHVRTLLEQKMALEALAEPILEFAARYPTVFISNYPGETGLLALRAAEDLLEVAPKQFREWLQGDFAWMDEAFAFSRSLRREAEEALTAARARAATR